MFNLKDLKKHIMTGISYMVPVVVGAGLCQALGVIIGGPNVAETVGSIPYMIYKVGNMAMGTMIIPVIAAAIAYSIADLIGLYNIFSLLIPVSFQALNIFIYNLLFLFIYILLYLLLFEA